MTKNKLKKAIVRVIMLVLPIVVLSFCQQPNEEIIENNDQVMTVDSDAFGLMMTAIAKSGDEDQCAEIVYPIGLYVYYSSTHNIETVIINSDKELLDFLLTLVSVDEISIDFPMAVMTTEGLVTIGSLSEMESTLKTAIENCIGDQWQYCDSNEKKVNICHNGNMLCVSLSALPAHLAHGDTLGECE